jgi:signal transduction histidine kinase
MGRVRRRRRGVVSGERTLEHIEARSRPSSREELVRLELNLVRIRWFGVAFGLFQVWQGSTQPPIPPPAVVAIAYALVVLLATGNVLVWMATRRVASVTRLQRVGLAAFSLDALVIFGTTWIYSYDQNSTVWVLLYILPLEGALRYRLRGAVATIVLAFISELGRELYQVSLFPDLDFYFSAVTFRVGILAIVALVAGVMARTLAEQAATAERRAHAFQELAHRESAARREISAFHAAVMAGIAGEEPGAALQSMADAIGHHLGYENLSILIVEEGVLRSAAKHGPHAETFEDAIPRASGVAERAAAERAPVLVEDVSALELHFASELGARSEMAAPMVIGDRVIGVIHVRSSAADALRSTDLEVLTRLADQVALVAFHAQLHAERAETVARLRELTELKSDFVAIASHELRTPLTGIRGFASLLMENFDALSLGEVREYLSIIDRQSQRLVRLVEDLLVVSKLEGGRLRLKVEEIRLRPFLQNLVASFADEARRITLNGPDEPATARLDADRMEQILRNLIQNALKFSPANERVTVSARRTSSGVDFEVADRGVGIAPDELANIFDRFHQAGDGGRREHEGVGLGLYIAKRLLDEMGGEITVESAPNKGATFRIRIPQRRSAQRKPRALSHG